MVALLQQRQRVLIYVSESRVPKVFYEKQLCPQVENLDRHLLEMSARGSPDQRTQNRKQILKAHVHFASLGDHLAQGVALAEALRVLQVYRDCFDRACTAYFLKYLKWRDSLYRPNLKSKVDVDVSSSLLSLDVGQNPDCCSLKWSSCGLFDEVRPFQHFCIVQERCYLILM